MNDYTSANNHENEEKKEIKVAGNNKVKNEVWEWVKALAFAVVLAILIRSFLFAPFVVDGESMMPTLKDRERLIVNKFIYLIGEPKKGDIIVFHATPEKDYIKRVIALGGETVEVRNDQLYVNGEPVDEPYLEPEKKQARLDGFPLTGDFGPVFVPEGSIFVMGDNRRNSKDSRMIGPIPKERVVGRADIVFWPIEQFTFLNSIPKTD
ncbi:signal peptidase I [Microaerobacter geothermalis]|uniref:signal peptidase I n=1 Tax=Microaerobacter geothermalis TaxID=674972 RepID=UPI001F22812D|nr:signal peptidase I [Microaerobacter geothermalis]MCF6094344.1 signal peptidase I [Microaerobacter geothermalis]